MIQTYIWKVELPLGQSVNRSADRFTVMAQGIMNYTSFLRGHDCMIYNGELLVSLRVYGKDRWAAQAHAREIGEKVFKASRMWGYKAELVEVITEPNRRGLKDGEGRTPRPRPPRSVPPGVPQDSVVEPKDVNVDI